MGRLMRGGLLVLLVFASLSCSDVEQGDSGGEEARPAPEEVTREVTKVVTVADPPTSTQDASPTRQAPAPSSGELAAPTEAPTAQEESPEDVLALQYRLINAGDYEGAYALFAGESKQLVSPDQYAAYFESNAPYSIPDY